MEAEKEELIDLHQSIVKSNLKLNNGLQEALKDAASQFEQQTAFAQQVQTLQKQVVSELGVTDSLLKQTFGWFLQEVKGGITSFQEAISMALKETRAETRHLEKVIQAIRLIEKTANSLLGYPKCVNSSEISPRGIAMCAPRCDGQKPGGYSGSRIKCCCQSRSCVFIAPVT